jgi:molecular chaperone DnaK
VEAKNQADQLIYGTEKLLADNAGKLPADEEKKVRDALEELKKAKDAGNADQIRKAIDGLNQASHKMAEDLYSQARDQQDGDAAGPGPGPGPEAGGDASGQGKSDGDVIDAEFEDVK